MAQAQQTKNLATDTHLLAIAAGEQAVAAKTSAEAAKTLSDSAKSSLQATIDNFHQEQRAWVSISKPKTCGLARPDQSQYVSGDIYFTGVETQIANTGRTPALNMIQQVLITQRGWLDPVPNYDSALLKQQEVQEAILKGVVPKIRTLGPFSNTRNNGGLLAPGDEHNDIVFNDEARFTLLDAAKRRPGINPPDIVYVLGKITYSDVFTKVTHTTMFCLSSTGGDFQICSEGSSMN